MTREEAEIIYNTNNGSWLHVWEKLGMIKFDKPETKLQKFEKWLYSNAPSNSTIMYKVKEIYGED